MLMSPSAAQPVVKQERLSVAVLAVTGQLTLIAKCTKQYALSVVRNVKYPSSLERAGQCIAANVTKRSEWAVNYNLTTPRYEEAGLIPAPSFVCVPLKKLLFGDSS